MILQLLYKGRTLDSNGLYRRSSSGGTHDGFKESKGGQGELNGTMAQNLVQCHFLTGKERKELILK